MKPVLNKPDFLQLCEETIAAHHAFRLNDPAFVVEAMYLKFFAEFVAKGREGFNSNIIDSTRCEFKEALDLAAIQVSLLIAENGGDGTVLQDLIDKRKIIFRRHKAQYNKQFKGAGKKGLTTEPWSDYNHWVIAAALWEGLVRSLDPDFIAPIPPDSEEAIDKLTAPAIKPLWGLWKAFNELGRPILSTASDPDGNCIFIREYRSWVTYTNMVAGRKKAV
jgi:hypothetical protein